MGPIHRVGVPVSSLTRGRVGGGRPHARPSTQLRQTLRGPVREETFPPWQPPSAVLCPAPGTAGHRAHGAELVAGERPSGARSAPAPAPSGSARAVGSERRSRPARDDCGPSTCCTQPRAADVAPAWLCVLRGSLTWALLSPQDAARRAPALSRGRPEGGTALGSGAPPASCPVVPGGVCTGSRRVGPRSREDRALGRVALDAGCPGAAGTRWGRPHHQGLLVLGDLWWPPCSSPRASAYVLSLRRG